MWWLSAMTPGRIPWCAQTRATKWPILVVTRTRSPVAMPSRSASSALIQSGWVLLISLRYLALPERVWISVGSRKVGTSTISPASVSISLRDTCDSM